MTDGRVVCVIQARQGSSRLPGKSLRPLQGRPLIAHVIERARAIPGLGGVILATSLRTEDDGLAAYARDIVPVFRGSEGDVLDRFWHAAEQMSAVHVMRITGDCPFIDPAIAASVLALYREGWDYAWNDTSHSGFPDGTDVEIFSYAILARAAAAATSLKDREHVTSYIRNHGSGATLMSPIGDCSYLKLSVDSMNDYTRACRIAAHIPAGDYSLKATMEAYVRAHHAL